MPLSKTHKAQTRERIVRSAGRVFRRRGFAGAGIAEVMEDAGLTHGGFYAHFASKEALFATVVATDHGLIRQFAARPSATGPAWRRATLQVLRDYLDPAHFPVVREGCTFAALGHEAARAGGAARSAYATAFETLVGELLRTADETPDAAFRRASAGRRAVAAHIAATAVGAVIVAGGCAPPLRDAVLTGALATVRSGLARLR